MQIQKRVCLAALALIVFLNGFSQDTTLQRIKAARNDSFKVKELLDYAKKLRKENEETATPVFSEALTLSQDIKYDYGIATASLYLGYKRLNEGKYKESIDLFQTAISKYEQLKMLKDIASAQLDLSAVYEMSGQSDSSIYYKMIALKVLEANPFYRDRARAYLNLGTLYNNLNSFEKAVFYQKKALDLSIEIKDTGMMTYSYAGLSLTYDNSGQKQESLKMAREALKLAKTGTNPYMLVRSYDQYAHINMGLGHYDEAIAASKEAIKQAQIIGSGDFFISASITLAKAYGQTRKFNEAVTVLEAALKECEQGEHLLLRDDVYHLLAQAHGDLGQLKKAADYYEQAIVYKDSIFSSENNRMVAEQEVKYKTAQKEKELSEEKLKIAQKDLELQKRKQQIIYSIAAAVVALLVAGLVMLDIRNKKKLHARQIKELRQEKELQLLQALMQGEEKERSRIAKDLHDGVAGMLAAVNMHFNTLALQVGGVLETESYQQGVKLLNEASGEVRKTSHNLMPEVLMKHGLDKALNRYCSNVSNSKSLTIQYDSWGEVGRYKSSFELSVYRIVQELLNNIVKHSKATQAIVQVSQQEGILSITVEDNGVGFNQDNLGGGGMGINSLKSRVTAINGKMQLDAEAGSGVSAYLEFDTTGLEIELHNYENS